MAITANPSIRQVLVSGDNILNLTAGAAIYAGAAVEAAGTGVSGEVINGVGTNLPVGVALYDAAVGAPIAVAGPGCVVTVASEETVDAGDPLNVLAAAGGTPDGGLVGVASGVEYALGAATTDITADGTGQALVTPFKMGGT